MRTLVAVFVHMPKRTRRWVDLDGLRILRRLELLTEHTIDDGGMVYLFDQVGESAALINHPDSCPYDMGCLITDELPDLFNFSCITELTRFNSRGVYAAAIPDDLALQSITDRMLDAQCNIQRRSFDYIYSLIRNHPCFEPGAMGGRPQISPRLQLFVTLARFADAGLSIKKFAANFKVGKGSVKTFSLRICEAIVSIERRFLQWPNAAHRRVLADYGMSRFGFDGYIGNQDGTHFYLKYAPTFKLFPETFYDTMHSGGYGYNVILTADHTGSVIHYSLGWPGSVHDASIQQHSVMFRSPGSFFEKGQYLFVDTGFMRTMWAVTPYKAPAGDLPHNKLFNRAMREGRCRIEHVNAVLKSRFQSLKKIPIKIEEECDHLAANLWIRSCLVLHNVLIRLKDEWEFYDVPEEFQGPDAVDDSADLDGADFQDMVRDRWLQRQGYMDSS
jgi:hypothetical protein